MNIYAVMCEGEGENIILCLGSSFADCDQYLYQLEENFRYSGYSFPSQLYWIEKIEIREGIFWETT